MYVVTKRVLGNLPVTSTLGSSDKVLFRLGRSFCVTLLVVKSPDSVWFGATVPVSLSSPRLVVSTRVYEPPVCTKVFGVGSR